MTYLHKAYHPSCAQNKYCRYLHSLTFNVVADSRAMRGYVFEANATFVLRVPSHIHLNPYPAE